MEAPKVNPQNLPAVAGTVPPSSATLGQESINAFNRARRANRAFMQRVENTPALEAAIDGVAPDRFVQQFITGQGASSRDVAALRRAMGNNEAARDSVRQHLLAHLRGAATNGTEDVNKFSPASYNRALSNIGDQKLSVFFSPEEIRTLRAVGRAGTYMTAQPAGTAVNNSNTGALLMGRGLDMLNTLAGRLPLGLDTTIQGVMSGAQQRAAMNVPSAIRTAPAGAPLESQLLLPALYGGLLATQPLNDR
jgi:hypothetical protein